MNTMLFLVILAGFALLVVRSISRAREAAAKITAEPDPVRVYLLQQDAITTGLKALDSLDEPPEVIAQRREALLQRQNGLVLA